MFTVAQIQQIKDENHAQGMRDAAAICCPKCTAPTMMVSDLSVTPRTDTASNNVYSSLCNHPVVEIEDARQLERELNEVKKQLAMANDAVAKGEAGRNMGTAYEECQKELIAARRGERDANEIKSAEKLILLDEIEKHMATKQQLLATEAVMVKMREALKASRESVWSIAIQKCDHSILKQLDEALSTTPITALAPIIEVLQEAKVAAEDKIKANQALLKDAGPESQFYGEDICTPVLLRKIENALSLIGVK